MNIQRWWPAAVLAAAILVAGCATQATDNGLVGARTLASARGAPALPDLAAEAGSERVRQLLAEPLTADSAVEIAFLNAPDLRALYAQLGFASAEVAEAARISNPVISGAIGFTGAAASFNRLDFGIAQSFTEALTRPARKRFARAQFARTQSEVAATALRIAAEVQAQYFACLGAQQLAALRDSIAQAAGNRAELAQRYFDAGNISRLQLSLQQSDAADAELEAGTAHLAASEAAITLNLALGFGEGARQWHIPETLPAPIVSTYEPADLQALAIRNRLDLAAAESDLAALHGFVETGRRYRWLGDFTLGVDGERDTDGGHLLGPRLQLALPLFDQRQGSLLRAEALLDQARSRRDTLKLDIAAEVGKAYAALAAAQDRLGIYSTRAVPLADKVVEETQRQYNFMLGDGFDLLLARQRAYSVYGASIEALRDDWIARAQLARAIGGALPANPEPISEPAHAQP